MTAYPELLARLRDNAHRWAPGAVCANEAITASGLSTRWGWWPMFFQRLICACG
jgi:hypothetical protein